MLEQKIENYLNRGYSVAAELSAGAPDTRGFVYIRAVAKRGTPREEVRYLNSTLSMWQYWDYEFRRIVLRSGWENDKWNYDRCLVSDERCETTTEAEFIQVLRRWVPDPLSLRHVRDTEYPG